MRRSPIIIRRQREQRLQQEIRELRENQEINEPMTRWNIRSPIEIYGPDGPNSVWVWNDRPTKYSNRRHTEYTIVSSDIPNMWELYGPYNAKFIEALKQKIPRGFRHWDPDRRCWMFTNRFFEFVSDLCEKYNKEFCIPLYGEQLKQPENLTKKVISAITAIASNKDYKVNTVIDLMDNSEMKQMILLYLEWEKRQIDE